MTRMGVILGTAAYMSPEQAKGRVADRRSDIWTFGCVLYEMLTGRRLFAGDTIFDTLADVLREPIELTLAAASHAAAHSDAIATLPREVSLGPPATDQRFASDAEVRSYDNAPVFIAIAHNGDGSNTRFVQVWAKNGNQWQSPLRVALHLASRPDGSGREQRLTQAASTIIRSVYEPGRYGRGARSRGVPRP
jgi:serine/threonine protein kinase